jgi:hypothetical protein
MQVCQENTQSRMLALLESYAIEFHIFTDVSEQYIRPSYKGLAVVLDCVIFEGGHMCCYSTSARNTNPRYVIFHKMGRLTYRVAAGCWSWSGRLTCQTTTNNAPAASLQQ